MYNHVGIQGRLTADPELRYTQSGTAIATFTLACDDGAKTASGEKITHFIDCVAWRGGAEFVSKYFSKGDMMIADGKLTTRNYEDKNGNRRKAVDVSVFNISFCGKRNDWGNQAGQTAQDDGGAEGFTEIPDSNLPF